MICNPISVNRFNHRIRGDEDLRIADPFALSSRKMSAATRKYLPELPPCFAYDTHIWICMPFKKLITTLLHPEDPSHSERRISHGKREEGGKDLQQPLHYKKLQLAKIAAPDGKAENWQLLKTRDIDTPDFHSNTNCNDRSRSTAVISFSFYFSMHILNMYVCILDSSTISIPLLFSLIKKSVTYIYIFFYICYFIFFIILCRITKLNILSSIWFGFYRDVKHPCKVCIMQLRFNLVRIFVASRRNEEAP